MEPWLSIAVLLVGLGVGLAWAWAGRPGASTTPDDDGGERSALDFVHDVLAEVQRRGVKATVVGGSFDVQVEDGRRLPLMAGFQRYARERVDDAASALVAGWDRDGLLEDREAFRERVVQHLQAAGHPAISDDRELRVRVGDALLVLDAAFGRPSAVAQTLDEIAAEVDWWRAPVPPLDEVEAELEVQILPAARVAREDLAARLRSHAAGIEGGPQPVAHLGAGWVARVVWRHGSLVRPVGALASDWGVTPEALLERVVAREPSGGHPLRRWQPGVLQAGHGDERDLRLLLLDDEAFAQIGIAPPVVVWPLQADRVVVASASDPEAVARLLERAFDGAPVRAPLCWVPLVRDPDGRWSWLALPEEHELAEAVERLVGEQLLLEYGWVLPAARALAEAGLEPPPVALQLDDDGFPMAHDPGGAALVPAEVRTVVVGERRVPVEAWVEERGAAPRGDLGPPWWQVG